MLASGILVYTLKLLFFGKDVIRNGWKADLKNIFEVIINIEGWVIYCNSRYVKECVT